MGGVGSRVILLDRNTRIERRCCREETNKTKEKPR